MQTFTPMLSPEPYIKSEVSDMAPYPCETADDESWPRTPTQPSSVKRSISEIPSFASSPDSSELAIQPRKRAKTQEEKEQRKLARVIRNRQAAQASREKKRIYLENLEEKCSSLEIENSKLKASISNSQELSYRLEQYEAAIKLAKSTGDLSSLDSVSHLIDSKPVSPAFDGTITGSMLNVQTVATSGGESSPKQPTRESKTSIEQRTNVAPSKLTAEPTQIVNNDSSSSIEGAESPMVASPAPSLEEDRSSPESYAMPSEEEDYFFSPLSEESEIKVEHDPFEVLNFSFDTKPAFCGINDLEKSSKSRHSAAMTPILVENYSQ